MVYLVRARSTAPENPSGAAPSTPSLIVWGTALDANHCSAAAAVRHETMAAASEALQHASRRTDARGGRVVAQAALSWEL